MGVMPKYTHGLQLIEQVINKVHAEGFGVLGWCGVPDIDQPAPVPPEQLAALAFPNGKPLSPALRRWLAFDASWLGWFDDPIRPVFRPLKLGEYVAEEFDEVWGDIYADIGKKLVRGDCYGLHFGADSRRFLYVGEPDSLGEYPVLMIDTDDMPYMAVQYPGLDVYLAACSGLIDNEEVKIGYSRRMKEQAERNLDGLMEFELGVDVWLDEEGCLRLLNNASYQPSFCARTARQSAHQHSDNQRRPPEGDCRHAVRQHCEEGRRLESVIRPAQARRSP